MVRDTLCSSLVFQESRYAGSKIFLLNIWLHKLKLVSHGAARHELFRHWIRWGNETSVLVESNKTSQPNWSALDSLMSCVRR
jgi:hypothetical protein